MGESHENTKRVLVLGGCISRDIFNYSTGLELAGYFARSSLCSIYGGEPIKDEYSSGLQSSFQRRSLANDLNRSFKCKAQVDDYDILLMDLINVRFDLYELNDGRLLTLSNEAKKSGLTKKLSGRRVKALSEEYFQIWREAFQNLLFDLSLYGKQKQVRVIKAYLAFHDNNDVFFDSQESIAEENFFLARLYEVVEEKLGCASLIEVDDSCFVADKDHRWGLAPFHYVERYYLSVLKKLQAGG